MASSDATPVPIKNQAYRITFPLYDADGDLVTAAGALDSEVSKDGGTFSDCTNEATEIATSSGMYYLDLTATEMNADTVAVIVKSTGAKTLPIVLYPQEAGDIPVDVESVSGDATAANNLEADYDGTGYAKTNSTIGTATDVTNQVSADVTAISGDATAADNLEAQYDTTGLSGGTFPATQDQLSNISAVGAAVNAVASSYVLTTGVQSANLYTDTVALDGTRHEHTDSAGAMELYYQFSIGSGTPTGATVTGYLTSANDSLDVFAWDWVAGAWVQIGVMGGSGVTSNSVFTYSLFTSMVGTGANLGLVRIRFYAASGLTSATLAVDQIYVSYSSALGSYEGGAIWIDTTVSNTNTVVGVDGVATNPVSTLAAALTISAAANINKFFVAPGSSITLAASFENYVIEGENWTLALGGQSISGSHIHGANVTGTASGASEPSFERCTFDGTASLPPCKMSCCDYGAGPTTLNGAGDYYINEGKSRVPGSGSPVFDAASNIINLSVRAWSGGFTLNGVVASTVASIGGPDCGTVTIAGADGEVDVRGTGKPVVDNRTGSPTLTVTGYMNPSAVDTELTSSHGASSWTTGGLTGANSVTVTCQEADTTPIVGAVVSVYNATNTGTVLDQQTTDSNGQVTFAMDAGTFQLRIKKAGVTFTQPEEIVVATDPDSFTITGTVLSIANPSSPTGCVLFGNVNDIGLTGSTLTVQLRYITPQVVGDYIAAGTIVSVTPDSAGHWEKEVPQGAVMEAKISGDDTCVDVRFVVPASSTYDLKGELPTLTA